MTRVEDLEPSHRFELVSKIISRISHTLHDGREPLFPISDKDIILSNDLGGRFTEIQSE